MKDELKIAREALTDLFALMDEGQLVRNVAHDDDDDWALRMGKFVVRLARAKQALAALSQAEPSAKLSGELPELPEPTPFAARGRYFEHYTADQMRAYALAALQSSPQNQEPVRDEREAFEAWASVALQGHFMGVSWDAWQARAALSAQPQKAPK